MGEEIRISKGVDEALVRSLASRYPLAAASPPSLDPPARRVAGAPAHRQPSTACLAECAVSCVCGVHVLELIVRARCLALRHLLLPAPHILHTRR